MPGTQSSGRPGGNPDIVKYSFTTNREEPLSEKITIRITSSMLEALKLVGDYRDFIRIAIAEKLEREKVSNNYREFTRIATGKKAPTEAGAEQLEQGQLHGSNSSGPQEPPAATGDEPPTTGSRDTRRKKQQTSRAKTGSKRKRSPGA